MNHYLAWCYNNVGLVYRANGELDQAKHYRERTLAMREKQLSPDHIAIFFLYNLTGQKIRFAAK